MSAAGRSIWSASQEQLAADTTRVRLSRDGALLSFGEAIRGWREDEAFCSFFLDLLRQAPFDAYFWETPAVRRATLQRPFEMVLVRGGPLRDVPQDPTPFREHFHAAGAEAPVVSFWNLRRDARLIAPTPLDAAADYGHLASFVATAPTHQQLALWRTIGLEMDRLVADEPRWVSTAGLGVYWLHVRLDREPKYYRHRPYREA